MASLVELGLRGADGRAGHCHECGRWIEKGPDACLGLLPGVAHACCGHGMTTGDIPCAYVIFGPRPDEPACSMPVEVTLRGEVALAYFRSIGVGPPAK